MNQESHRNDEPEFSPEDSLDQQQSVSCASSLADWTSTHYLLQHLSGSEDCDFSPTTPNRMVHAEEMSRTMLKTRAVKAMLEKLSFYQAPHKQQPRPSAKMVVVGQQDQQQQDQLRRRYARRNAFVLTSDYNDDKGRKCLFLHKDLHTIPFGGACSE